MIIRTTVLLTLCVLLFTGCSDSKSAADDTPATANSAATLKQFPYQVLDVFEVGNRVYVRALAVNRNDRKLWVGTSIGALEIDLNNLKMENTYTRQNGLANEYVFSMMAADDGSVWLGTNGGGVSVRHNEKWRTYFPMHGLADYWVYSFAQQDRAIWIGTWAGLSRFDRRTGEFKTYLDELVNEWVYGLALDSRGQLWVGTEGGINMYDGQTWQVWTHEQGLGAANDEALPLSKNTGLGTRQRHDLSVLAEGRETYNPNYVFTVMADDQDRIWAGTWGGGVARYDGRWVNYTRQQGVAGNIVYSLAQDQAGRIWAGTNGGVSVFDGDKWFSMTKDQGLPDEHIYSIVTFEQQVWLGMRGAVIRLGRLAAKLRSES